MKFIVNRQSWNRGSSSVLLSPKNKCCVLGFLAKEIGYCDRDLLNMGKPSDLPDNGIQFPECLIKRNQRGENIYPADTAEAYEIIDINDDPKISDSDREVLLTRKFYKIGIQVEFIN